MDKESNTRLTKFSFLMLGLASLGLANGDVGSHRNQGGRRLGGSYTTTVRSPTIQHAVSSGHGGYTQSGSHGWVGNVVPPLPNPVIIPQLTGVQSLNPPVYAFPTREVGVSPSTTTIYDRNGYYPTSYTPSVTVSSVSTSTVQVPTVTTSYEPVYAPSATYTSSPSSSIQITPSQSTDPISNLSQLSSAISSLLSSISSASTSYTLPASTSSVITTPITSTPLDDFYDGYFSDQLGNNYYYDNQKGFQPFYFDAEPIVIEGTQSYVPSLPASGYPSYSTSYPSISSSSSVSTVSGISVPVSSVSLTSTGSSSYPVYTAPTYSSPISAPVYSNPVYYPSYSYSYQNLPSLPYISYSNIPSYMNSKGWNFRKWNKSDYDRFNSGRGLYRPWSGPTSGPVTSRRWQEFIPVSSYGRNLRKGDWDRRRSTVSSARPCNTGC